MSMMKEDPVVIAGAGLAGALMAVYMARKGHKVEVYEKRPDMRKETVAAGRSINLALSVRGISALKEAGIMDEVEKIAIPMKGRMVHPLGGEDNFQPYSPDSDHVYLNSVSRALLNMKLMDIAEHTKGVKFHFNHACAGMDTKNNEATFTNTKTNEPVRVKVRTLMGCDGAYSGVRYKCMQTKERFEYSQSYIEHSYKELHIPPGPNGEHQMMREALHIWPRGSYMMIALPNIDGSFTCTLFFPHEGPLSFASLDTKDKVKQFFEEKFPDAIKFMPSYLDDYFNNPTASLVTIKCFPWAVGDSVVLVGDAAHAIVPFYGQGMNAAFESCQELSKLIDQHPDNWTQAYSEFEKVRKPNADAIAELAVRNFIEMRDLVADKDFLFKKKVEHLLEAKFPERYISQYELVSFSTTPYAEAQRIGKVNAQLLEELTKDIKNYDPDAVDMKLADKLIKKYLNK